MAKPDKRDALVTRPKDFDNRLFYAARNLAIEALCLRIETGMLRKGLDVTAVWRESSLGNPTLELKLKNPKMTATSWEFATATVAVTRDRISVLERPKISECFYRVASVHATEYWPWRESKYVGDFRELVKTMASDGYFEREVDKVNYPFDYNHHSSF
jgi:hypothetical protein